MAAAGVFVVDGHAQALVAVARPNLGLCHLDALGAGQPCHRLLPVGVVDQYRVSPSAGYLLVNLLTAGLCGGSVAIGTGRIQDETVIYLILISGLLRNTALVYSTTTHA